MRTWRVLAVLACASLAVSILTFTSSDGRALGDTGSVSAVDPPSMTGISGGSEHTCLIADGTVWCSGANAKGQLGNGSTTRSLVFVPSLVVDVVQVDAGGDSACAVRSDKTLWCWGSIVSGMTVSAGRPTVKRSVKSTPVQVPLTNVTSVAVGPAHACAVLTDRTARCWGSNTLGQLGNGTTNDSDQPVPVRLTQVRQVDVGDRHTCAVTTSNSVWCWGSNTYHQLGRRSIRRRTLPQYIPTVPVKTVATGGYFTCIATTGGRVQCWGRNNYGQVSGPVGASRFTPRTVALRAIVSITAGAEFACATSSAQTWCWGRNRYGQLANGSTFARWKPQKVVPSLTVGRITKVSAGISHACGITTVGGALWCWGLSKSGQLGDGGSLTRLVGTAIWPNGVRLADIGTDVAATVVAAGDISCNSARRALFGEGVEGSKCGDAATAAQVASLNPDAVVALGDLQYEGASLSDLLAYYDTTWGTFRSKTYPVRGNHEYLTAGAAGYVAYFGSASPSYWWANVGGWRLIAVDSWCTGQVPTGCAPESVQTQWLEAQLQRAHDESKCAVVVMHHPFVSSGAHAADTAAALWAASVTGGADLVVTGHDHIFERFAPLGVDGFPAVGGTPLFVSGLGGAQKTDFVHDVPGSEFRSNDVHGVLVLGFTPSGFTWSFDSAADGSSLDSGTAGCTPQRGTSSEIRDQRDFASNIALL